VPLQQELVGAAAELLAPQGILTYSVCTLTEAETLGIDRWLAEHRPDLRALPPPGSPWSALGRGALLLPQAAGTDGMYVLRVVAADGRPGGDPAGAGGGRRESPA
jgi:16S rRNA (cytosine967-C5)-methyltransferase